MVIIIKNKSIFNRLFVYFTLFGVAAFWVVLFEPAPCDILFALAIAAWLVDWIINRKGVPLEKTDWLLLGFLLTGWVGLAYTPSVPKSIEFSGITTYLAVFYYIIRQTSRDFDLRQRIIYLYLGSALITAGIAWAAIMGAPVLQLPRESFLTDYYSGGATALFKDPNVTGVFMVPAALYFLWRCLQNYKPVGLAAIFLFTECAVFLTLSRGAVMSLGLGCLIIFLLTPSAWRKRLTLMVLSVLVIELLSFVLAFYPPSITSFERVFPHITLCRYIVTEKSFPPAGLLKVYPQGVIQDYDTGGRFYAWQAGLGIFKERPLLGAGPGSFERLSPAIEERLGVKVVTPSAHNLYIRALAENGFVGFALLMGFLIYAWRGARYKGDNIWIKAALIALLVYAFFIDTLHHRHFWLLLALL